MVETDLSSAMDTLSKFLDTQTPYFQARLDPRLLPERESEILDCLASAERPQSPSEISAGLRGVPINAVSTYLKRLLERRLVRRSGQGRAVRWDVAEPLFRVWRRFRTGYGERARLLLLADFVAALYEPVELMAERSLIGRTEPESPRLQLLGYAIER